MGIFKIFCLEFQGVFDFRSIYLLFYFIFSLGHEGRTKEEEEGGKKGVGEVVRGDETE